MIKLSVPLRMSVATSLEVEQALDLRVELDDALRRHFHGDDEVVLDQRGLYWKLCDAGARRLYVAPVASDVFARWSSDRGAKRGQLGDGVAVWMVDETRCGVLKIGDLAAVYTWSVDAPRALRILRRAHEVAATTEDELVAWLRARRAR